MPVARIVQFNKEVLGINRRNPYTFPPGELAWLLKALREEVQELEDASNVVAQADALIDCAIFAIGGLVRLGIVEDKIEDCFDAVMDANFRKRAGQKESRAVAGVVDAVKPEGWQGPEDRLLDIIYS